MISVNWTYVLDTVMVYDTYVHKIVPNLFNVTGDLVRVKSIV